VNKIEAVEKAAAEKNITTEQEQQLATDLELISLLRENPDILERHPELIASLVVPHQTGGAISLIERQIAVLRKQNRTKDENLRDLMEVARDNVRLSQCCHQLAVNLLAARDLDDVISTVLDVLQNDLAADHAVIKLFSSDENRIQQSAELFVDERSEAVNAFKTMLRQNNTVCGKGTSEQKQFLFNDMAESIKSVAIIPLIAGSNLGLIGLGANDSKRFNASMGTEFLTHVGELVSAAITVQLED